eukprot:6014052-Prymnesium_polylepis.1
MALAPSRRPEKGGPRRRSATQQRWLWRSTVFQTRKFGDVSKRSWPAYCLPKPPENARKEGKLTKVADCYDLRRLIAQWPMADAVAKGGIGSLRAPC